MPKSRLPSVSRNRARHSEAIAEYKRRYGRDPPRGFDDWWEFAKEQDFKLVDEFDAVVEDLAPFWALSGEELRQRTYLVGSTTSLMRGRARGSPGLP